MLTTDDLSFLKPSHASDNLNLIFGTGVRVIHHSGVSSKSELCIQNIASQLTFTSSKSATKTLEKGVKYFQS